MCHPRKEDTETSSVSYICRHSAWCRVESNAYRINRWPEDVENLGGIQELQFPIQHRNERGKPEGIGLEAPVPPNQRIRAQSPGLVVFIECTHS